MATNYNHDRSRLIYDLTVRQEPKQARMCGVGGKADRRPIDPPPIVQLRVIDPALQSGNSASGSSRDSNPDSTSSSPRARPFTDDATDTSSYAQSFLQNPYYFMFASLARPDDETELHWLKDGRTRCTTGSVVSSLYHLKDPNNNNEDAGFFVFPDLSVRTEGSYRLKLSLFEVVGNNVHHCKSIYSAPFYVYTAKKFPGMEESTPLSCSLADQGIKIRIRKDIRVRKRPIPALSQPLPMSIDGEESEGDEDEDDDEDVSSGRQPKKRRENKRSRLDSSIDAGIATNHQQMPWPPAASINPALGPTIPPPPAAPPNVLPSSPGVIPPPPKPGKETPPVNGIAMGVHVPPGSTLPGPSVFDGRGGGIIPFEPPQPVTVESPTQTPVAQTTSPSTAQYRDANLSDESTSPQTLTISPQMSSPVQQPPQTQQQQHYAAPAVAGPGVTSMAPHQQQQQYQQQSAAVASPAVLPPQQAPQPTHAPPPFVQHQPQHPQQHIQQPQPATPYAPAHYSQWSAPMPAQPSVYDPYYHHPQHPHYTGYAPPPPQQTMPPPPTRYDYGMYNHGQPTMGGYGYYEQHQQHHPHPQAQMVQPPPHAYPQHQVHAPPVPHQFAPPPATPSTGSTAVANHAPADASQTNGMNGTAGSTGSMPPPGYASSTTPVSGTAPVSTLMAAAPNAGYDYGANPPVYNNNTNRPHAEAATSGRAGYAPTPSTPAPAAYGGHFHPTLQQAPPPPPPPQHSHPQVYSMHTSTAPPPHHPSHGAPMRSYAPHPHAHHHQHQHQHHPHHAAPPPYSYTPYNAPLPPAAAAPEWNAQPFVGNANTSASAVATHQQAWDAYGHHQAAAHHHHHQVHGHQSATHVQPSPVAGAVNGGGGGGGGQGHHRIQLAPLAPADHNNNDHHSAPPPLPPSSSSSHNASAGSPTIVHSPAGRHISSTAATSSSPTTLRTTGVAGRVSMRDREEGHGHGHGHGYQQGKKNPLSIGSIISEDVR